MDKKFFCRAAKGHKKNVHTQHCEKKLAKQNIKVVALYMFIKLKSLLWWNTLYYYKKNLHGTCPEKKICRPIIAAKKIAQKSFFHSPPPPPPTRLTGPSLITNKERIENQCSTCWTPWAMLHWRTLTEKQIIPKILCSIFFSFPQPRYVLACS